MLSLNARRLPDPERSRVQAPGKREPGGFEFIQAPGGEACGEKRPQLFRGCPVP